MTYGATANLGPFVGVNVHGTMGTNELTAYACIESWLVVTKMFGVAHLKVTETDQSIGFMVGGLLAGAVVTESVFSWPGIGQLIVNSVSSRDVAVVQCVLVLVATTMVVSNMIVDLLYGLLDPRMREAG